MFNKYLLYICREDRGKRPTDSYNGNQFVVYIFKQRSSGVVFSEYISVTAERIS